VGFEFKRLMKFLIIQINDQNAHNGPRFTELAEITNKSTQEYCDLHGYDYLFLDENPDPTRQISWGRTFLVKQNFKKYDWILCIDSDLMIMNHTIKLEHLIDERYSVIVAANEGDVDRINTGSILWKTDPFSEHLISAMYLDNEFANKGYWEQSTLIKLIKEFPKLLDAIKIVNPRWMNSFYHYWFGNENYQHGDFCVHLAGSDNDYRHETLSRLKWSIIKPVNDIQEKVKIWDR
jgi:hypothetical protein